MTITTPNQAILDFAATGTHELLRFVLANAEFQGLLDVTALQARIGQGVTGTKALTETTGHTTPAQIRQDRRREFDLRAKGYIVLRYTEEQLVTMPEAIAAEIASYL